MTHTLYYGDNLDVLRCKVRDETIDLCYIDPPFNSKRNYFRIYNNVGKEDAAQAQAFMDTWTWNELSIQGFQEIVTNDQRRYTKQTIELIKGLKLVIGEGGLLAYLVSMTQRINEIWRVLKPTGSFYLHCDPTASHYLKLLLDSKFLSCGGEFINEIVWWYRGRGMQKNRFQKKHDILLWFSKNKKYKFQNESIRVPLNPLHTSRYNKFEEDGRRYALIKNKTGSHSKIYFKENGIIPDDVWDIPFIHGHESLGYPTQKPESLLERIIQASSNEGDMILDAYCGCGTTIAVAQRLKRNWIGIDITYQSIAVILKRLEDSFGAEIMDSIKLDGIPKDMESAKALANKKDDRVRKEFEKWAVLTYSKNRAIINDKKGADKGIDGIAYFNVDQKETARVIFQVKSGHIKRSDISILNSDRIREQAELAVLITLEESTKPMRDEAMAAGLYHHAWLSKDIPRVQIVTIQEMIEETKRLDLPWGVEVLKEATQAKIHQKEITI